MSRPGPDAPQAARVGAVLLTMGGDPDGLAGALDSIAAQRGVAVDTVVVVNAEERQADEVAGWIEARGDARVVRPGRNLGIPEGRNVGAAALDDAELLLFLDDDARLLGDDVLARAAAAFAADPSLGAVSMRLVDPDTGATERRHVPRLRVGDPARASWVTTLLGGACLVRADAFRAVGGLPGEFFYAHEETSLAWRLLDRGWRLRYRPDLEVAHPAQSPSRHPRYYELTARNRVLLARRHLPVVLGVAYVTVWAVLGLVRGRGGRRAYARGLWAGLRYPRVERDPISWATAARMSRYGRPPVI